MSLAAPSRADAVLASPTHRANPLTQAKEDRMQLPTDPNAVVALLFGTIVGVRFIVWWVESIPDGELTPEDVLDHAENINRYGD